ncbi:serine/threonine protein kinase [Prosthecobacter sp.]|uniref:serine/threonine protein kinase n=1 Tax=Prosthecobacter sp. TaxID=1965333 RepID=UPI003783D045
MNHPLNQVTIEGRSDAPLQPGLQLFHQRYELVKLLGGGGMGVVWLAKDRHLNDKLFALKFLPGVRAWTDGDLTRLRKEVLASQELRDVHLAATYGFEYDPPYAAMVMEHVDGRTLKQALEESEHGCFEPEEVRGWMLSLVAALKYLHGTACRIHRDLKTANVMITRQGRLKLLDFGISENVRHTLSQHVAATPSGSSSHTLSCASPQQLRGEPAAETDDIYSLGALLYELLTGRPPFFRGNADAVGYQIRNEAPANFEKRRTELLREEVLRGPLPQVAMKWQKLVFECLAKEPYERPTLDELDDFFNDRDYTTPQPAPAPAPASAPAKAAASPPAPPTVLDSIKNSPGIRNTTARAAPAPEPEVHVQEEEFEQDEDEDEDEEEPPARAPQAFLTPQPQHIAGLSAGYDPAPAPQGGCARLCVRLCLGLTVVALGFIAYFWTRPEPPVTPQRPSEKRTETTQSQPERKQQPASAPKPEPPVRPVIFTAKNAEDVVRQYYDAAGQADWQKKRIPLWAPAVDYFNEGTHTPEEVSAIEVNERKRNGDEKYVVTHMEASPLGKGRFQVSVIIMFSKVPKGKSTPEKAFHEDTVILSSHGQRLLIESIHGKTVYPGMSETALKKFLEELLTIGEKSSKPGAQTQLSLGLIQHYYSDSVETFFARPSVTPEIILNIEDEANRRNQMRHYEWDSNSGFEVIKGAYESPEVTVKRLVWATVLGNDKSPSSAPVPTSHMQVTRIVFEDGGPRVKSVLISQEQKP